MRTYINTNTDKGLNCAMDLIWKLRELLSSNTSDIRTANKEFGAQIFIDGTQLSVALR